MEPTVLPLEGLTLKYLLVTARPKQWTKNGFVFFALIFSLNLLRVDMLLTTVAAFILFCLLSSSVYLINDLVDIEQDRQHPLKRNRPLPAGLLSPRVAKVAAGVLAALALIASFPLGSYFWVTAVGYWLLMLVYSFYLKHIVIIDVLAIAAGFVLRVVAGAVAIQVPISPWLYICTILGALFLGFTKRRHELILLENNAHQHRKILEEYSPKYLEDMINIVAASTIMAYSLYTFSADNLPKNHSMMLTIPFVLFGIFRYLYLVHQKNQGGNPEEILLTDKPILADIALWLVSATLILYFFR